MEKNITQERVRQLFDYKDGSLIRKVSVGMRGKKGDVVGWKDSDGYLVTGVDGKNYKNHRLIWLWFYGYLPENCLDHKDKNPSNNDISNLREASKSCNGRNSKISSVNKSGVRGVSWVPRDKIWRACISINSKLFNLGSSIDFTEAVARRLAAEQCLNWADCDVSSPAFQYMQQYLGKLL